MTDTAVTPDAPPAEPLTRRWTRQLRRRLVWTAVLVGAGLGGKVVFARQIEHLRGTQTARITRPLAEFPRRLGLWEGVDEQTNADMIRHIKIDDWMERTYTHPSGEKVVLWFAYSKRSLDQYHYPTVCMTGSGWEEEEARRQKIFADGSAEGITQQAMSVGTGTVKAEDTPAANALRRTPAMRMYFNKDDGRRSVYYWYYLIGEDPVDRTMRELSKVGRVFLRARQNASLTVEVFSQSNPPNEQLLDEFAKLAMAELAPWMPAGTEAACDLGATY